MQLRFITAIFLFLSACLAFAQKHDNRVSGQEKNRKKCHASHLPHTFIIKLNSKGSKLCNNLSPDCPIFNNLGVKIKSISQLFPGSDSEGNFNLEKIFQVTYIGKKELEKILMELESTGLVDYAEPSFINYSMYTPNDPAVNSGNDQFYLKRYGAFEAWDITQGDSNVVIGIIDTGVRFSHEDLKDNVKYNVVEANGTPGFDDDGDGYIDNITGWDFGNSDNNPDATGNGHGTIVAGIAAATPDNGKGGTGTGFHCKFMPVKAAIDSMGGVISFGYQGLYYAALHDCQVVNLSWGSASTYSQFAQDLINYVVEVKDVVVVAAAGNSAKEELFFPASYNNVLSVAACDTIYSPSAGKLIDTKSNLATYDYSVDLCAQGRGVYGTENDGSYSKTPGSSNAAPQVAGAAGLVRSRFPNLTAQQVMERLRISGDIIDTFPENALYKEKIGRRLNMLRALTDTLTPSLRIVSSSLKNKYGEFVFSGDTAYLEMNFINYLYPTTDCKITLTSSSPYVEIIDGTSQLGSVGTLASASNQDDLFIIYIREIPESDYTIPLRVQFEDGTYYDYQHFKHLANPSWLTVNNEYSKLTITSNGRLGYADNDNLMGDGFVFQDHSLLYESGLMLATSDSTVSDCIRAELGTTDRDFEAIKTVRFTKPYASDIYTKTVFNDSGALKPIGLTIEQNSFAWTTSPQNKFQIVEYIIQNKSLKQIDTLFAGIFTDWDIMDAGLNKASWSDSRNMGYIYSTETAGLFAGVALLTPESPIYFALDHSSIGGDNINPNDGFPSLEKYQTLSQGVARKNAGGSGSGGDVSHIVGAVITNLAPMEKRKVAFAIMGAVNLSNLYAATELAKVKYKSFNTGTIPEGITMQFCTGDTVSPIIAPANGSVFNFYSDYPLTLTGSGTSYEIKDLSKSDTLFVTNIDSIFESGPANFVFNFNTLPKSDFTSDPEVLNLSQQNYVSFINNSIGEGLTFEWDFGDEGQSTDINPVHYYDAPGEYPVKLLSKNDLGCRDSIEIIFQVINEVITGGTAPDFNNFQLFPVPVSDLLSIKVPNSGEHVEIKIINSMGLEIFYYKGSSKMIQVPVENWSSGQYIINIISGSELFSRSFVKH